MKVLLRVALLLLLATGLSLISRYNPGQVILIYPPWRIELSLVLALFLLAGLLGLYCLLSRFLHAVCALPRRWRTGRESARTARVATLQDAARDAWLAGDAARALAEAEAAAGLAPLPGWLLLQSARAAGQLGQPEAAARFWSQAQAQGADTVVVDLVRAHVWLDGERWEDLDPLLADLEARLPGHPEVQRLAGLAGRLKAALPG